MNKHYIVDWAKATLIRTLKTFAEVMLAFVGVDGIGFGGVDWAKALSVAGVAAIACVLSCLVGLPECDIVESIDE